MRRELLRALRKHTRPLLQDIADRVGVFLPHELTSLEASRDEAARRAESAEREAADANARAKNLAIALAEAKRGTRVYIDALGEDGERVLAYTKQCIQQAEHAAQAAVATAQATEKRIGELDEELRELREFKRQVMHALQLGDVKQGFGVEDWWHAYHAIDGLIQDTGGAHLEPLPPLHVTSVCPTPTKEIAHASDPK